MKKLYILNLIKNLKQNRRGGPIFEEILLIGIAVVIFVIIMGVILGLIDWTQFKIDNIFS
ncbi:MAG: hypothetical protein KAS63_01245 [Candidatus Heimdallarchaeota archaeon]|nr:hypothetical protein [Candidatus Heimdallarchaeota archaeon]MCK4953968.1 hypothetical protein [Candidatus Heimdallarchaeota archaeon]